MTESADRTRLLDLIDAISPLRVERRRDARIRSLATDSRRVGRGDLFFAVPGVDDDGARYVAEAVARGAVAVVVEGDVEVPDGATAIRVESCRRAKAVIASRFYGDPSRRISVVGVTGTNGKTTTTHMLRSIAEYEGGPTVLIGTVRHEVGTTSYRATNTTPDPIDVHRMLAEGVAIGAPLAAMEVSSHALEQDRVHGLRFRAAVFTNLSPEHLDYHGNLESYRNAKAKLFRDLDASAIAVLNADDPLTESLARETRARVVRFGVSPNADVTAGIRRVDIDGVSFILRTARGNVDVNTRMVGRHNLQNAIAAATAAYALGYPLEAIRGGFQLLKGVPGRLEPVDCGQDFRVLVDYAHTDDALEQVLRALRPLTRGRLVTVFGCGGDRDRTKRPRMGAVATRLSDVSFVTSDNPRSEDPLRIIDDIVVGVRPGAKFEVEVDRRAAISRALRVAQGGDIVLIAGKGHEDVQVTREGKCEFDDRTVAREVLWNL